MLKAILFDFNGVIINDEPIHEKLICQLLVEENLRPQPGEFRQFCLGCSDRACLSSLLSNRGRTVNENYLDTLIARKAKMYQRELESMEKLPMYPGLEDFIFKLRVARLKMAVVSGALRMEIDLVLHRNEFIEHFPVIVSGDEALPSKPAPDGYLKAVELLNRYYPELHLEPGECLAIEDTFAGIQAAKAAGIPVVGVANSYPFHMLQRRANWTVDYLSDLELERIQDFYAAKLTQPKAG
jgi:HAD superfamily hydrolase (TIGR01509 family)